MTKSKVKQTVSKKMNNILSVGFQIFFLKVTKLLVNLTLLFNSLIKASYNINN